jgi:hypothetical protein
MWRPLAAAPQDGVRGGRRVDLHTHTHFSDGLLAPGALVALAIERQLAILAITDHDSVEALPHAAAALRAAAAAGISLELVPGIEISTAHDGLDLHILGLYVDSEHAGLLEHLARFRGERIARARAIVERLVKLGAPVDAERVLGLAGPGVVGRPHVAQALIEAGHVDGVDDAFRRYLGAQGSAYVPRPAFHPEQAIEIIHAAGGVSVLAHPGASLAVSVVEGLVAGGLRGIEVWHPQHGVATVKRYRELARRLGLLESGGSDFHSPGRGADLGDMPVPLAAITRLKEAAGVAA